MVDAHIILHEAACIQASHERMVPAPSVSLSSLFLELPDTVQDCSLFLHDVTPLCDPTCVADRDSDSDHVRRAARARTPRRCCSVLTHGGRWWAHCAARPRTHTRRCRSVIYVLHLYCCAVLHCAVPLYWAGLRCPLPTGSRVPARNPLQFVQLSACLCRLRAKQRRHQFLPLKLNLPETPPSSKPSMLRFHPPFAVGRPAPSAPSPKRSAVLLKPPRSRNRPPQARSGALECLQRAVVAADKFGVPSEAVQRALVSVLIPITSDLARLVAAQGPNPRDFPHVRHCRVSWLFLPHFWEGLWNRPCGGPPREACRLLCVLSMEGCSVGGGGGCFGPGCWVGSVHHKIGL